MPALNLLGPTYTNDALPASAQDSINWIPEIVEAEGRGRVYFRGAPGCMPLLADLDGALRGHVVAQGVLYVVAGSKAYRIDSDWSADELGTVTGSGRVGMAANRLQVVIVNGVSGYVITLADDSFETITDEDFGTPSTATFINNYIAFEGVNGGVDPETKGIFFLSDLNDATSYTATTFATAQADPDNTVAVFGDHQELFVFGVETVERWVDVGGSDFPLAPSQGQVIEVGCGAKYSIQKCDNTLVWLDQRGWVRMYRDGAAVRISTHAIEQEIAATDFAQAVSWQYRSKGHWFYGLQLEGGKTFVYDASNRAWHRRKSYGMDRWRMAFVAEAYGVLIGGDATTGTLWELRDSYYTEGADPLIAERYTQYIYQSGARFFLQSLELIFDTGHAELVGSPSETAPVVELRYSDDSGRTYSDFRQASLGLTGQYAKQIRFHGLGSFQGQRMFHVRVSDPVKRDWVDANARAKAGFRA